METWSCRYAMISSLPPHFAHMRGSTWNTFEMSRAQLAVQRRFLAGYSSTLASPGSEAARSPQAILASHFSGSIVSKFRPRFGLCLSPL